MMHVVDVVLNSFADLFRFHRYSPVEKLSPVVLFMVGLSCSDAYVIRVRGGEVIPT
jgi:hypothetical protein